MSYKNSPSVSVKIDEDGFLIGSFSSENYKDSYPSIALVSGGNTLITARCWSADHSDASFKSNLIYEFRIDLKSLIEPEREFSFRLKLLPEDIIINEKPIDFIWRRQSTVVGHFETLSGDLEVSGWAVDKKNADPALVDIYLDGKKVNSVLANTIRPDVGMVQESKLKCGFKQKINSEHIISLSGNVSVRSGGDPLTNPTKRYNFESGFNLFTGAIENGRLPIYAGGYLGDIVDAKIFVNGVQIDVVSLVRDKPEDNYLKCFWIIPEDLCDGVSRVFQLKTKGIDDYKISELVVLKYPEYSFELDVGDFSSIGGWVKRKDRASPVFLKVSVNDQVVADGYADHGREDVKKSLGIKTARYGFHFDLTEHRLSHGAKIDVSDDESGILIASLVLSSKFDALKDLNSKVHGLDRVSEYPKKELSRWLMNSYGEVSCHLVKEPIPSKKLEDKVVIILPIYDGFVETVECIESLIHKKINAPHDVVIINDCSPNEEINNYLKWFDLKKPKNFFLLNRKSNGGFSEAVNAGIIFAGRRDVVIVNADAVVQDGWLDNMLAAARIAENIATVTPFTNNGEVATYPYLCKSLNVKDEYVAGLINKVAKKVNCGKSIELPVAIGFCMYINRYAIDDNGLLDAAKWGRGYGEETEFCIKAMLGGWKHVLAADTFVVHRGSVSFGHEKMERVLASSKVIAKDYPFYDSFIQRYISDDPSASLRRNITIEILSSIDTQSALLVTHNFGGGTKKYVDDLARLHELEGRRAVVLSFNALGEAVLEIPTDQKSWKGFFEKTHVEKYSKNEYLKLLEDVKKFNFKSVHLNSPFGLNKEILSWAESLDNLLITVHDYSWICPWVTMTSPNNVYHGDLADNDFLQYPPHPGLKYWVESAVSNGISYIDNFKRAFSSARVVISPSTDVMKRMIRHGVDGNYKVVQHPVLKAQPRIKPLLLKRRDRMKVGIIGAISSIKGYWNILELLKYVNEKDIPMDFLIIGYTLDDTRLADFPNVEITGRYDEDHLYDLVSSHSPDVFLFNHVWPETFSYTLSLAFELGVWPVSVDIGALPERIEECGYGTIYDASCSPEALSNLMLSVGWNVGLKNQKAPPVELTTSYADYLARLI